MDTDREGRRDGTKAEATLAPARDSPWLLGHRKFPRAEPPVSLPKLFPSWLSQGSTANRKLLPGEANTASGGLHFLSR